MKIKICIAFMLELIVIGTLWGCGTSTNRTESSFEAEMIADADDTGSMEDELIDNTAQFSNSFTMEGKAIIQDMAVTVDFGVIYPDLESVYNSASNVVAGEVMDVQYTDDDAIPRTIYTFAVSETLNGDIEKNSFISISESNGYLFLIFPFSFLFCGLNIFTSATFTALSNGKLSAVLSFLRTFGLILVLLLILPEFMGVAGVWLAVPIAELLTMVVALSFLYQNKDRYHYA